MTEVHEPPPVESRNDPPSLAALGTTLLFGGTALLLFAVTHWIIPAFAATTNIEPVLLWFLAGGLGVFAPLMVIAYLMLRAESAGERPHLWQDRLRFRAMTALDWAWSVAGITIIAILGAAAFVLLRLFLGPLHLGPPFLKMEPLTAGRYWILAAWLPFWVLNIFGEELLWRGVVLPRQETAFGKWAWVANGSGWLLFHVAFGVTILATLWPILFLLPYIVQRRRNSWVGVAIHAGVNGPGFVAVAFGLV